MKPSELEQFRADLGVFARRTKHADEAMRCLQYSLARSGSSHRAAALCEAYVTLPLLDSEQRKHWGEYDALDGLTLGQAVRELSSIQKRVAERLEKPTDASPESDASVE